MKKQVTAQGIEHGLLEMVANSIPDHGFKTLSEKNRKEMLAKKEKDLKLMKVRYQNLMNQETGKWEGWYGDYAGEPMMQFKFLHDHVYEVPRGLVKKVNDMGAPVRSGLIDSQGKQINVDGKTIRSHQLIPESDF